MIILASIAIGWLVIWGLLMLYFYKLIPEPLSITSVTVIGIGFISIFLTLCLALVLTVIVGIFLASKMIFYIMFM